MDLPPVPGALYGVAARSSQSAVAVGGTLENEQLRPAMVALWNGTAWKRLSSPALPAASALFAVALFRGGAWAVGQKQMSINGDPTIGQPLMVRVTGTTVREVPVPRTASGSYLHAVAATSATDAWAVGGRLLLHWNGTAWTRWPLPAGLGDSTFTALAATSANAWAVTYAGHRGSLPAIMHWNGRRWGQVASPDIGMSYALSAVAATSARDVFAVGSAPEHSSSALLLHWNGRSWTCARAAQIHLPKLPELFLNAVSASSADNAWAVGSYFVSAYRALALHWNGHTWQQVMIPGQGILQGGTVIPQSDGAWAVGVGDSGTLILHWNGTAWQ
jgi:hypothetical protein